MSIADKLAIYGAVLSTILAISGAVVYWRDRSKVSLDARFVPSASLYIVEVRNSGTKPITIAAVGINQVFFGADTRIGSTELATGVLPHRLEAHDKAYFSIYWRDAKSEQDASACIYVRDANNKRYKLPLHLVRSLASDALPVSMDQELSPSDLVALYDAAVWQDENLEVKARIAMLDAEIDVMVMTGLAREKAKQQRKSGSKQ